MAMIDSIDQFQADMLGQRGVDPAIVASPGVLTVAEESRAGSRIVAGYVYGSHFVIFCDPEMAEGFVGFDPGPFPADSTEPLERFGAFVTAAGAEILGSGAMRVLTGEPVSDEPVTLLDRDKPADVARIQALVDDCTPGEVEDAAIEMDELDPVIWCAEQSAGGPLTAYASAFPDDDFGGRWDIGVLTHPDHRRQGLGRRAVACLVAGLVADGQVPIYRHALSNAGSAALSESLGFEPATVLLAARFPEQ